MEDNIGKICPYCKEEIKEGDAVKVCPSCGVPQHESCWEKNGGCAAEGCGERQQTAGETGAAEEELPPAEQTETPAAEQSETAVAEKVPAAGTAQPGGAYVCPNCGARLKDEQRFCPNCGTPRQENRKNICMNCGAELRDGQDFCTNCGQKVGLFVDSNVNSAINQFNMNVQNANRRKKRMPIIIGACAAGAAVIIVLAVALSSLGRKDFNDLYPDLANETWCTIASDGSYIKIDTNPYDTDEDDFTNSDYQAYLLPAWNEIEHINADLGFSEALMEKMKQTSSIDGRQEESNDKYSVSWTYHPDRGLEVTYEIDD